MAGLLQDQTIVSHEIHCQMVNNLTLILTRLCDLVRGPCPMMNTLANHGFLPHDGKNLTQTTVIAALKNGLNFDEDLGSIMYRMAIVANPEPNATYFTLGQLNRHNILEHDASLR